MAGRLVKSAALIILMNAREACMSVDRARARRLPETRGHPVSYGTSRARVKTLEDLLL